MGIIFSYIDKDDTAAAYYSTAEQDEVIDLGDQVSAFELTNAGDADMYIVTMPGGAQHRLGPGDRFEMSGELLYSVTVTGAAGQKVRYAGARG